MNAADILIKAHWLVGGDRASTHGDKVTNHLAIAAMWNGYLLARRHSGKLLALDALDAANMMEVLKIARRLNGAHNLDDYIDGAGYAGVAGEIAERTLTAASVQSPGAVSPAG